MARKLRGVAHPDGRGVRARRRAKRLISYKEPSSDIDTELEDTMVLAQTGESSEEDLSSTQSRRGRAMSAKKFRHFSPQPTNPGSQNLERSTKRRATRRQMASPLPQPTSYVKERQNASIIPPWQTLPYHVLVQIFSYASCPLYEERTFQPTSSVNWLVKVARLCRSFAEPALTVLYKSPPLVPMERAHKLRQLLIANPSGMTYNYRAKIERLQIEVSQTATYTLQGYGLLDLYGLIRYCQRLVDLEIFHQKDMPPYRNLDDMVRFTYPSALFLALKDSAIGLRSWRWNSRMAGQQSPIKKLRDIHLTHNFNGLRKLCFVNYQQFQPRQNVEDPQLETMLAESLSVLPDLEYLIFESSTLLNAKLLPLLPRNLRYLEFINCCDLVSEDVASFLVTHGSHLRSLTLNHNQALSLSFLQILGSACQNLTALKMNLTYYSTHMTYPDSDPRYEKLLYAGEIPQWPVRLQELELTHLRNWDTPDAEMFFQSLVDSAAKLLDLRRIVIKATLNTSSWRDRVRFRDVWIPPLIRVFKRPYSAPNQQLRSLSAFARYEGRDKLQSLDLAGESSLNISTEHQNCTYSAMNVDCDSKDGSLRVNRETRHSTRLGLLNSRLAKPADNRPSQREIGRRRAVSRELATLRSAAGRNQLKAISPRTSPSDPDNEQQKEFVQGMCDVVNIIIDNLRPSETQFVEADFLDSEPEGDEDWDGS